MKNLFIYTLLVVTGLSVASSANAYIYSDEFPYGSNNQSQYRSNYQYQQPYQYYNTNAYPVQNTNNAQAAYNAQLAKQVEILLVQLRQIKSTPTPTVYYRNNSARYSNVDVQTVSATKVDGDSAFLRGEIDLNRGYEANVYFIYGTSKNNLNQATQGITIDSDDNTSFSIFLRGLQSNRTYYFQAIAVDEFGDRDYGDVRSFKTERDTRRYDVPKPTSGNMNNITDRSAHITGTVDMKDYSYGRVFFVVGEDKRKIDDVDRGTKSFDDVREYGYGLRKYLVDNNLNGNNHYSLNVNALYGNTKHYYAICVEYVNDRDNETISCGTTKTFTTKRN